MIRLILSYITFPGIIVHEFAHAQACRWLGIKVLRTCYLRIGNPLGYVLHERPKYAVQHVVVAVAPFFVSSLIALAVSSVACVLFASHTLMEYHDIILPSALWIGFSVALHAFPSRGDADALWNEAVCREIGSFARILIVPFVGLIRLAGVGTRVCLDVLYALCIVVFPSLFLLS